MISIIGIIISQGAIADGYFMEHGKFMVLVQPAELVIIFGAAVGTLVFANPRPTLIKVGKGLAGVFSGNQYTKALYLETLKMLYELFSLARKDRYGENRRGGGQSRQRAGVRQAPEVSRIITRCIFCATLCAWQ